MVLIIYLKCWHVHHPLYNVRSPAHWGLGYNIVTWIFWLATDQHWRLLLCAVKGRIQAMYIYWVELKFKSVFPFFFLCFVQEISYWIWLACKNMRVVSVHQSSTNIRAMYPLPVKLSNIKTGAMISCACQIHSMPLVWFFDFLDGWFWLWYVMD